VMFVQPSVDEHVYEGRVVDLLGFVVVLIDQRGVRVFRTILSLRWHHEARFGGGSDRRQQDGETENQRALTTWKIHGVPPSNAWPVLARRRREVMRLTPLHRAVTHAAFS